jgi:folate-binding protein YgfZ
MNHEWQAFLAGQSGAADAGAGPGDCALFDLTHLGLIGVSGPDTDSFLQGQVTNDLRELTEGHSHLSSHCSAKGRMLASFRMLRRAGAVYLQLPADSAGPLLKRLQLYRLRARVELTDATAELVCIGLAGDCAGAALAATAGPVPERDNDVTHHQGISLVRVAGPVPRFLVLGPAERLTGLWTALREQGARRAGPDAWTLLNIRAGLPSVYEATREAFVPQMTNLQLVDGVSFTKGCYTGQEVVARMQYLGKLKRRMYRAEVTAAESPPRAGDELFSGSSASLQGAGRVVEACPLGDGRHELLAVVEIAAAERHDVHLGQDGPALRFLDLPYRFAEAG